jgi:hypothetical protein
LQFLKAAAAPPMKLELKVSLFVDIADMFLNINQNDKALAHLLLSKKVRGEKGWKTTDIENKISALALPVDESISIKELLAKCKTIWQGNSGEPKPESQPSTQIRNLKGKIVNYYAEKPFCFIKTADNQSYFCSKDDLPKGIGNDQKVKFDIKPSFDKKKGKNTFKAVNISAA